MKTCELWSPLVSIQCHYDSEHDVAYNCYKHGFGYLQMDWNLTHEGSGSKSLACQYFATVCKFQECLSIGLLSAVFFDGVPVPLMIPEP